MIEKMNLNVQPITFFEVKGVFLVTLFPSISKGIVSVLCGEEKNAERVRVIHDCLFCKAYGHENCPYVLEGMKYYMIRVQKKYHSYTVLKRKVVPNPRWKQIPMPTVVHNEVKEIATATECVTQHFRGSYTK